MMLDLSDNNMYLQMTSRRKEEMQTYRRQAMKRENTRKSRHREKLVAKVQSIVAEVEVSVMSRH